MKNESSNTEPKRARLKLRLLKIMKCLCSGEQYRVDEVDYSPVSLATKDYTVSGISSQTGVTEPKLDNGNIEEAESTLRESGCLNYEEARALLGRYEYQKGNVEAALHVFEGIDIAAVTPKMKQTLSRRRVEHNKRHPEGEAGSPMSIHAVSLLLEAFYLKAKSLQTLEKFKEAAQPCKVILDIVESSQPGGLPENIGAGCKLQETLSKAVELLPDLWKLADCPTEAILSYRRALLHHWNLEPETVAKIQKEFAIFILYSGGEAAPPDLRYQMDSSFVPKNTIEEAILLLMILLKKVSLKRIEWDPSILDHLIYALSVSGELTALANQVEQLVPGIIDRNEMYLTLSLCYYGAGEDLNALNLLRKLLVGKNDLNCVLGSLMASKICGENADHGEEGIIFSCRAIENLQGKCDQMVGVAKCLYGISLSASYRSVPSYDEKFKRQSEALKFLENAGEMTRMRDPNIVYHLSLENAEQRKLNDALTYAKCLLKLENGSHVRGFLLLARILSAQKQFVDAESIIDAALDQTGIWEQGELLRTKAKLQLAQGQLKGALDTYTQLLAILQVKSNSFGCSKKHLKVHDRSLELETWHDLARIYINMSQWSDVEICLSKSETISRFSASRWHVTGLLHESKGFDKKALEAFWHALEVEPSHIPSLVSAAIVLRRLSWSQTVAKCLLTEALRLDETNASAWYNLGLIFKDEGATSAIEAAECFQSAAVLEETEPVEPFR